MFCGHTYRAGALAQWLKLPAWKVGDRDFEPHSGLQVSRKQNVSSPITRKDSILWENLCDRELSCSASDRQGLIFESCVCRAVSSFMCLLVYRLIVLVAIDPMLHFSGSFFVFFLFHSRSAPANHLTRVLEHNGRACLLNRTWLKAIFITISFWRILKQKISSIKQSKKT